MLINFLLCLKSTIGDEVLFDVLCKEFLKSHISKFFDSAVAKLTGDLLPIVTIYVFFDGISVSNLFFFFLLFRT